MMVRRFLICLLLPGSLLVIPFLLRPGAVGGQTSGGAVDRLVIISSHNKGVKDEYDRAFRKYYREHFGRDVVLDFRSPGGTRDVVRYIADRFESEFRFFWEKDPANGPWTGEIAAAFADPSVDRDPKASPAAKRARKVFLDSDVGIGIDLMAGGGTFEMIRHASKGFAVDAGVRKRHPEYFRASSIPEFFGGDRLYDADGRWYGVVLSTFGICCNADRISEMKNKNFPAAWRDLADPRFFDLLSVADPSKSGSANKCFEIIVQQCMAEAGDPARGWENGLNLVKRIFGNARSVTESASQVVLDVTCGDAAAGMAIDTYALSQAAWTRKVEGERPSFRPGGGPRVRYITPRGGTAVSADPIQLLRGAPNRRTAERFIDFLLSLEGQKLHCFKVGVPGGPVVNPLNRPAVRKELYRSEYDALRFEKDYDPYRSGSDFVYRSAWTGKYYGLLSRLIKCIMLEPSEELQAAWRAVIAAGGPDKVPEAMAAFNALPFSYAEASAMNARLRTGPGNSAQDVAALLRSWSDFARKNYIKAAELARKGR